MGEPEYGDISRGTLLDLLPKAARVQLVSVSADTARTLAGLDGVSRTYQESLSEYEPAGDTVLIVTDTQTLPPSALKITRCCAITAMCTGMCA